MTDQRASDRDVSRAIRSWLHEDRHEDVSHVAGAVLDQVDAIPQRRATWWPAWSTPTMNKLVTYGIGAVAVVAILFVGAQFFGSSGGFLGANPTPTPSPEVTLEPTPSPTPEATPPPLTQTFTSTLNGISVSYPEGWDTKAATEPWTGSATPVFVGTNGDLLYDPILEDHLFLMLASQPIGDATPEDWAAAQMAAENCAAAAEPIQIDGGSGLINRDCTIVAVTTAGRGYEIMLLKSEDDPAAVAAYDGAWFDQVLATVHLQPEDAVD